MQRSAAGTDEQRIVDAARGLMSGLSRLSRTMYRRGEFTLSRSHTATLDALLDQPRRVTDLAAFTGLTQPRMTVLLQELEERGLVERRRCTEDRRSTKAHLTDAGREMLDEGRHRMASALLAALQAHPEATLDPDFAEHAVTSARTAVCALLDALEPPLPAERTERTDRTERADTTERAAGEVAGRTPEAV